MPNLEKLDQFGTVLFEEPMSLHTSMRTGGRVRAFVTPQDTQALKDLISYLEEINQNYHILGRGSNSIFPDYDMDLVVISINKTLDYKEEMSEEIIVGAGYSFQRLAKELSKQGYEGLEFAGGIPGTIGGAVYMNAGAHLQEIKDVVAKVVTLTKDSQVKEYTNEECQFSYRHSVFQENKEIIIEVVLKLKKGEKSEVFKRMSGNLAYRKELQPLDLPSCGSVFKNPPHMHAGMLIEQAGLKGLKVGGAMVSTKHANFIVNTGDATSEDVMDLIKLIQAEIKKQYQIELINEVKLLKGINGR